jgi:hypothetical protein
MPTNGLQFNRIGQRGISGLSVLSVPLAWDKDFMDAEDQMT